MHRELVIGESITPKRVSFIFEKWLKGRGLDIHAHQLRHWYATELLRNGVDLRSIQKLLGHKNIETTARYLDIEDSMLEKAVAVLDYRPKAAKTAKSPKKAKKS